MIVASSLSAQIPSIELNNKVMMPLIGLGTFDMNGIQLAFNIRTAMQLGYRAYDTASAYCNEKWLGRGLRSTFKKRENYFVATKLSNEGQRRGDVSSAYFNSLKRLGLQYVDLYLMHWPNPETYLQSWKQMEKLYKAGKVRAIGVCNFHAHHLNQLMNVADVVPVVNQIELHPLLSQQSLVNDCNQHGIRVTAYTPLARMDRRLVDNEVLRAIAKRTGKTVPQVILRWNLQKGIAAIPKTSNRCRLKENIAILDFNLTAEDVEAIDGLNESYRVRYDPDNCDYRKL